MWNKIIKVSEHAGTRTVIAETEHETLECWIQLEDGCRSGVVRVAGWPLEWRTRCSEQLGEQDENEEARRLRNMNAVRERAVGIIERGLPTRD